MGLLRNKDWKEKGLKAIEEHKGKKQVYEVYQKKNPQMAEEYLKFVSKNSDATYISWDKDRKKFVL
ncbi:MAG: hypothetical protein K8S16_00215 [Bacteroidales bacterium]|nr:hypothetical protein [Bacteroidales bacterium]